MRRLLVLLFFVAFLVHLLPAQILRFIPPCPPKGYYRANFTVVSDPGFHVGPIGLPSQGVLLISVDPANRLTISGNQPQLVTGKGTYNPFTWSGTGTGFTTIAGFPNTQVDYQFTVMAPSILMPLAIQGTVVMGANGALPGPAITYGFSGNLSWSWLPLACTNAGNNGLDPVSTATGELTSLYDPDLFLGGPLPLFFRRYYGSLLKSNGISSPLGNNWMHNFDLQLLVSGTNATVVLFGGRTVRFVQSGGAWQLAATDQRGFQLVSSGSSYQFVDPADNLILTFSSTGALIRIEDRNGNALTVTPSASGPLQVSDGLGRSLTFSYVSGQLTRVQDQAGRSVSFGFTGSDLAALTGADGKTTTYTTTAAGGLDGLITSAALPLGNKPLTQAFDSDGRVIGQTDSRGNKMSLSYNTPTAGTTTVTDTLGNAVRHSYGNLVNLSVFTDPASQSGSFTYDNHNRRTLMTDRLGDKTTVTYNDPSGYPASVTNALGNTTSFTYTAQVQGLFTFYNLTKISYPDGASATLTYDGSGNLLTFTDPAGKTTTYTYNTRGQVLTRRNAAGGVTTYTYNSDGTLASVQSPAKDTSKLAYDDKKRPSQITYADNNSVSSSYDNRDNFLKITDERGKVETFTYDDNNNLKTATDHTTKPNVYAYDTDERLASLTDRLGKVSKYTYNENGALKTFTNAAGESLTFGYDAQGRLTSLVDSSGKGDRVAYDKEGLPASLTDALSRTWSFTTDKLGRLVAETTPLAEKLVFVYDSMGRLTSTTNALSQTRNYTYDARDLLTRISLPAGVAASFTRNDLGLITGISDPNGGIWTQAFDNMGRLTSETDPLSRATSYTYDSRNRVTGVTTPQGTATFTYDAAGNLTQRQYSDGATLTFSYDDNDRVVSGNGLALAYDARGGIVSSNGQAVTRDDVGRISGITYAAGKNVQYSYNSRGLLSQVTDWVGGVTTLTYDDARQLVSLARPNGVTTQYTYDKDGRLTGVTETKGTTLSSVTLTRDGAGQIISADRNVPQSPALPGGLLSLGYNAAHQVSGYTYDGNGRLAGDGVRTYTWDLADRLTSYSGADGLSSFTYDAAGLRVSKTTPAGTQNYVLNYALRLPSVAVVRDNSGDRRYYVYLPNGVLLHAVDAADNKRHFYHFDEMGSTIFLTDDTGAITDTYGITPYGETVSSTGTTENPFTFLGARGVMQEGATGLYYMRARFFDSATARFLSRDPVRSLFPTRINPYQYASASPLRNEDPRGLQDDTPPAGDDPATAAGADTGTPPAGGVEASTGTFNIALGLKWVPLRYTSPVGVVREALGPVGPAVMWLAAAIIRESLNRTTCPLAPARTPGLAADIISNRESLNKPSLGVPLLVGCPTAQLLASRGTVNMPSLGVPVGVGALFAIPTKLDVGLDFDPGDLRVWEDWQGSGGVKERLFVFAMFRI